MEKGLPPTIWFQSHSPPREAPRLHSFICIGRLHQGLGSDVGAEVQNVRTFLELISAEARKKRFSD